MKRRPVLVNSLTGASLCAASDALAQYLEEQQKSDQQQKQQHHHCHHQHQHQPITLESRTRRILSAAAIGMLFGGLVYPTAYAKLDSL